MPVSPHAKSTPGRPSDDDPRLGRPALAALQIAKLTALLREIVLANPFWTGVLRRAGVEASDIRSLADLPRLPLVSKADVAADQRACPPYGTNLTYPLERYTRLHQTSGTTGDGMCWLDTPASWDWFARCWSLIYDAAGVRSDDRFFFAFSFGPFIGFWAAFEGAQRRGHFCLSGGGMTSAGRLCAMLRHRISVLCCTPTYALHLAQTAAAEGIDLAGSSLRLAIVAGEPGGSVPGMRDAIERGLGVRVIDHTGMTEMGAAGVECLENPGHVHIIESEFIAELVEPATGRLLFSPGAVDTPADAIRTPHASGGPDPGRTPHASGGPDPLGTPHASGGPDRVSSVASELSAPLEGELVLTNLGRLGSPLIRYRTGDIVRLQTGSCPCGRHWVRMVGGIVGRADDMLIIRGNNVYPSAIDAVIRQIAGIAEYQVAIGEWAGLTTIHIRIERQPHAAAPHVAGSARPDIVEQLRAAIKERLFFSPDVSLAAPGTLPRFELKARRFVRE